VAISNEALEWLNRAEQARQLAQLTDPGTRKAVLELAEHYEGLARAATVSAAQEKGAGDRRPGENLMISPARVAAAHRGSLG
jgi:hypothetical protein